MQKISLLERVNNEDKKKVYDWAKKYKIRGEVLRWAATLMMKFVDWMSNSQLSKETMNYAQSH